LNKSVKELEELKRELPIGLFGKIMPEG